MAKKGQRLLAGMEVGGEWCDSKAQALIIIKELTALCSVALTSDQWNCACTNYVTAPAVKGDKVELQTIKISDVAALLNIIQFVFLKVILDTSLLGYVNSPASH